MSRPVDHLRGDAHERNGAVLEWLARRDGWIFIGGLTLVSILAWTWLLLGAGMDMSAIDMTRMAGMDGALMRPATWTPGYAALMFSMWWIMMIAMMVPGAAPMLLLVNHMLARQMTAQPSHAGGHLVHISLFAGGYLVMWGLFSFVATGLQWSLERAALMSPMLEVTNAWLGAGILIAAGAWQFTSLKARCLAHCRNPVAYVIGHWRAGRWGALRMGLGHGGFCLGCCWFLMALLFFGGVMNLYWIVGLSVFVVVEKTVPSGHWFAKAAGILLVVSGLALLPVTA